MSWPKRGRANTEPTRPLLDVSLLLVLAQSYSLSIAPVMKCKIQAYPEFLQWTKRYWDQYYTGGDYDALAQRKGAGTSTADTSTSAKPHIRFTGRSRNGRGL